jgi:hypothetical protein
MKLEDLIEALDQRYGNPYTAKENALIQEAIQKLKEFNSPVKTFTGGEPHYVTQGESDENCNGK